MDLVNVPVNTKITDPGFGRIGSPPRLTNPPVRNAGAAPAAAENFMTDHRILRAFAGLEPGDALGESKVTVPET